ncbi:MAG: DNA repair protein RecO [Intestinimonas sp.]|jgi:DNA repair protein RecO (recombination protein O)|nr:DNA repair protein RecO [Intestinimonas sp.]
MQIATQGLVLRETEYKDADKILTVLTREGGKRTVRARGCRRRGSRLTAAAQLLVWSDMTLFEYRDRYTLNEADALDQFLGVRSDLDRLALASYFAEVTEAAAEEGRPDGALLSLILNSLYALDRLKKPLPLVKAAFELKLLCITGYEPLVDACAVCGTPEPEQPRLSLGEGVIHCAACRVGRGISLPLDASALAAMRHIVLGNPKRLFSFELEKESLRLLSDACQAFLLTQMDRGFRTLDFYRRLSVPDTPTQTGEGQHAQKGK